MKFFVVLAVCLAVASATPFPQDEVSFITNGKKAAKGQFPYQVGLSLNMVDGQQAWCSGSLISPEWILTAAHCVDGYQSITAYLGGTVRRQADVTRSISKSNMIVHELWNMQKIENDIALLHVTSVPLSSDIQIVKLPAQGPANSYVNSYAIASGWGHFKDSIDRFAINLQYGRMKVVANSECDSYYGNIHSTTLCVATPDHVSPCEGDSGGPLVLESSDRAGFKVQIGLISHGSETGCEKGYPEVCTRISSYLDWIRQKSGVSS